jgi:fatty acid desaturase
MLRYREDLRTLAFVATFFGLVAFQFVARPGFEGGLLEGPLGVAVAAVTLVLTAFFSFFGAVATHNTVHCPVFKKRWHNRVFQAVLTTTYGHPVSAFVPGHNLSHHKHTQTRRDVMRTSKVRFRWHLLNGLLFMAVVGPSIMRGENAYYLAMRKRNPPWFRQLVTEFGVLYALYGVLLFLDWKSFLLYVFLPHKYAAWGIITMNMLQHDGCDERSEYNHSRNFVGKVVNWFTFNNGYHTIHHMEPGLHWSLTPHEHDRRVKPFIDARLDEPSLLAYLFRTFVWPGKRLRYDGTPLVLPEEGPDESWVPAPKDTVGDLGAVPS